MGKKKKEHIVFDQTLKQKKSIPFSMKNSEGSKNQQKISQKGAKGVNK